MTTLQRSQSTIQTDTRKYSLGLNDVSKEGLVLYNFTAETENEISVKEKENVEVIEDLSGGDEGWSLIKKNGKKGIIPTSFYQVIKRQVPSKPKYPPNSWRVHIHIQKITDLDPEQTYSGQISFTWTTKKKMGNTGKIKITEKVESIKISKSYDVVETFVDSLTLGVFKSKYLRILVKTENDEFEIDNILLNNLIMKDQPRFTEKGVPCVWCKEHPKSQLIYKIECSNIE